MPQVFGADDLDLLHTVSLFYEAASEQDIERATHPRVAEEARARGMVPHRMSGTGDPLWIHPPTQKIMTLTPAHSGDNANYTSMANLMAKMKRQFPTAEEQARRSRSDEEVDADQAAAAQETRTKKQEKVDAAKRAQQQEAAARFKQAHFPFRNPGEVQQAFDVARQSEKARMARPDDTVEQFTARLRALPYATRQQVHKSVFPERYK